MQGEKASFNVTVTDQDVQRFAELTGDFNRLHVDNEYAKNTNFGGQVVHGALLVGYISRLMGMHIPGEKCIINNIAVSLINPVFVGSEITVSGRIKHFSAAMQQGRVEGEIKDAISIKTCVKFRVEFSTHHMVEKNEPQGGFPVTSADKVSVSEKNVLMIGGNGGIGNKLCASLLKNYAVTTAGRNPLKNDIQVDLSNPDSIKDLFPTKRAFGSVICLASDPLLSAPLMENDNLHYSVTLNSVGVVSLADNAFENGVERLVMFSSTMGDADNLDGEFATYALGKNILNASLSLLGRKYAGRMEIYNIVLGNMFLGLTAGSSEIKMKKYNLSTLTKQGASIEELSNLVEDIISGKLISMSGNKIRFTGGL